MATTDSPGKSLWDKLRKALHAFRLGPVVGDRTRPVIHGVNGRGELIDGMTVDGFLAQAGRILADSGRVYDFEGTICYESAQGDHAQLMPLATQGKAEPHAAGILTNLFVVGAGDRQSLPATRLVGALLADEGLRQHLPIIRHYARRPVFDEDFQLCRPGWNPDSGILVHGHEIEPASSVPTPGPESELLDRLPPRLKGLLGEFCWRSEADLANALGVLLTGMLMNHFIDRPHPVVLVDANQPGLGKTLLVQAIGRILDGHEPARIPLASDEELEKRLCAQIRDMRSSLFFFDNVRGTVESALLEQSALSPVLTFRILGQSTVIRRPNAYLWAVTSNATTGTSDFIRRGVPIRLHHEGDPKGRRFGGDPLEFATLHRLEILGELAGMVVRWVQEGRPAAARPHRCAAWAATIGGILDAGGLGDKFLGNLTEAEAAMDQDLQALAALAEQVAAKDPARAIAAVGDDLAGKGMPAAGWVSSFADAGVARDRLAAMTTRGKETAVGSFLGAKLGRSTVVAIGEREGTATLRMRDAKRHQKLYFFEFTTAEPAGSPEPNQAADAAGNSQPLGPRGMDVAVALVEESPMLTGSPPAPTPPAGEAGPVATSGPPAGGDPEWL
ncbi:hypothetical protein EP7_003091 [Isosphaeraceae bacterium EP7]